MKKRPLCMAVLILLLVLWLLPAGIWMEDPIPAQESPPDFLTGEVCRLEEKEEGQTVCLKHTNISDTGMILVYLDAGPNISIGNTLKIKKPFEWKKPEKPGNPGQFDAQLYYQTKKIVLLCYAEKAEITDESVFWLGQVLHQIRERLENQCLLIFGEERGSMMKAILLGDKSELAGETKDLYQKSGMSHLLSISGLHVSILGLSLYRLLRKLGASYGFSGLPSMALIMLYGILTGMSTSTTRAVIMLLLAVLADILGRSYDMLTALSAAALLILMDQPLQARSASFLLSFGAVLGIGLLYPVLSELFQGQRKKTQAVLLSLSIQLFTIPLIQYFYYEIPVYSVCLNLLVIPLMSLLLPAGILSLAVSFLSLPSVWIPAWICKGILAFYELSGGFSLRLPGSVWICGQPEVWQIVVYYLGLAVLVFWRSQMQKKEKCRKEQKGFAILCLYLLFLNGILLLRFQSGFRFTMLDVGQGDGLFLQTASGTTCLIDGGSSSISEVGSYRIQPFLKSQGIRKLDYVFVTHMDSDHISGIRELLELSGKPGSISIGTLLLSRQSLEETEGKELQEQAEEKGISVQTLWSGMCLQDKSTEICCLHPEKEGNYEDKNAASLVLEVRYGTFTLLLTGDLEETGEQKILKKQTVTEEGAENNSLADCDVLKAGHHGARSSTTETWLAAVQPEVALISCGADNSYGHPHAETLERLEEAGSRILTTPECGAVAVRSDGEKFWVEIFLSTYCISESAVPRSSDHSSVRF